MAKTPGTAKEHREDLDDWAPGEDGYRRVLGNAEQPKPTPTNWPSGARQQGRGEGMKRKRLDTGRFYVMNQRCDECLFGPNKIVSNRRRAQVLKECRESDTHFICHKATIVGHNVCCAGFAESHSTNLMRIAQRLGVYTEVDLAEYQAGEATKAEATEEG